MEQEYDKDQEGISRTAKYIGIGWNGIWALIALAGLWFAADSFDELTATLKYLLLAVLFVVYIEWRFNKIEQKIRK